MLTHLPEYRSPAKRSGAPPKPAALNIIVSQLGHDNIQGCNVMLDLTSRCELAAGLFRSPDRRKDDAEPDCRTALAIIQPVPFAGDAMVGVITHTAAPHRKSNLPPVGFRGRRGRFDDPQ